MWVVGPSDWVAETWSHVNSVAYWLARPWTIEELVREKGDRMDVVGAIAELDALGLVTRINKRVVCASRTAIHADRLDV